MLALLERRTAAGSKPAHLYVEDFEALNRVPPSAPGTVPAEPVYGEGDVEAARQAGYAAGRAAGCEQALGEAEARRAVALEAIAAELRNAREQVAEMDGRRAAEVARQVVTALRTMLPDLTARFGAAEACTACRFVLGRISDEPEVTIRVSESARPLVQAEVDGLDPDRAPHVTLIADAAFAPGDVRITWKDGRAVRDSAAVLVAVEQILSACGIDAPREMEETPHDE